MKNILITNDKVYIEKKYMLDNLKVPYYVVKQ
jgi:hypothetical protein